MLPPLMRIEVKVQPNSGREKIIKISEGNYKLFLKKTTIDRKANEEIIRFFKKKLGWNAKIIKGFASKNKLIEV